MKALILAAGRGSRMDALTSHTHKCLIHLLGRPLIEWQLDALRRAGIEETIAVTGYKHQKVAPYFSSHFHNADWASTNMAYTLLQADPILAKEEVIVCYSDLAYHPSIIKALLEGKELISLTFDRKWKKLWQTRFDNPLDDAESFRVQGKKLVEIGKNPCKAEEIKGQYMGLFKIHPQGWQIMKSLITPTISMTELFHNLIYIDVFIEAIPIEGKWCEIDTAKDKDLYEKKLTGLKKWSHDFRD